MRQTGLKFKKFSGLGVFFPPKPRPSGPRRILAPPPPWHKDSSAYGTDRGKNVFCVKLSCQRLSIVLKSLIIFCVPICNLFYGTLLLAKIVFDKFKMVYFFYNIRYKTYTSFYGNITFLLVIS